MIIGIPNGLLYLKYMPFIKKFYEEMGIDIIISPQTNIDILNEGVKYCVDEACLPVKIFHGHVAYLRNKCDFILVPRIMQLYKNEFICPKFCGLPEMIKNSIPNLPRIIDPPLYAYDKKRLINWGVKISLSNLSGYRKVKDAIYKAKDFQLNNKEVGENNKYKFNIAICGHPYNVNDKLINMNLIKKLNYLGIGCVTQESFKNINRDIGGEELFKKPFWTFANDIYGFISYILNYKKVEGIIYLSSFDCGIDSIIIELVKEKLKGFPLLILKVDEHSGEAGFNTRIEAFTDMIERRSYLNGGNISSAW